MAKVELKQPIVQEISENIKDAQSVVVVNYLGLTVAEDTELRKQLREAGVVYKVYKNTLVNFAIKGTEFESLADCLEGPNAFAISTTDATAPARILAKFEKTAPALEIKAGVVEGTFYDENGMMTRGTLIRHLVLPGLTGDSIRILERICDDFPGIPVSLMGQYTPCGRALTIPGMDRKIRKKEYARVLAYMEAVGLDGYRQELGSADGAFIPAFDGTGV